MDSSESQTFGNGNSPREFEQNVIVMRHGDRLDNVDPLWLSTAARPWDPPLAEAGHARAFATGRQLRNLLGFPLHRAFVSPFLRCVQTAATAAFALCAARDDAVYSPSSNVPIDASKLKVSIEYELCEMLNKEAIRVPPKDGNWGLNITELKNIFPSGMVDHTVKKMPQWEETVAGARTRYEHIFHDLADKFPSENLLLVTHGEGVGVSVSAFLKDTIVYEVDYCAYSHLRRTVIFDKNQSFTAGNFEVLTKPGQTGIGFCPLNEIISDS